MRFGGLVWCCLFDLDVAQEEKKRERVGHTSYGVVAVIGRAQESTVIFLFLWDGDLMPDHSCMMYV